MIFVHSIFVDVTRWADGYCNTVPSLVERLHPSNGALVRGINGPWSHNLPHMGFPGPSVDWLAETVKWVLSS